jgi:hypothetical protein
LPRQWCLHPTYAFFWYDGSDAVNENAVIAGALGGNGFTETGVNSTYAGLLPGNYTIVVRDVSTQCLSQQRIETVGNASPPINPVAANIIIPTSCNTDDGELEGSVQVFNSSFVSVAGTDLLTTAVPHGLAINDRVILSRDGANPLSIPLEPSKVYFVESVPTGTTLTLKETLGGPVIDLTTSGSGFIGDYGLTTGYTFSWYQGAPAGVTPTDPIDYFSNPPDWAALIANPANPSANYVSLSTGIYSLEVVDNSTQCKTYITHTLPFIGAHAVIRISKTNSTVCSPVPGNGSITIRIEDPVPPPPLPTYDILLKQGGATVAGPFINQVELTDILVSNTLNPGTYVVEVEQNFGTNCILQQDVTIDLDAKNPIISLASAITQHGLRSCSF